ncbi:hypothetical protein FB45DRAFT_862366 [Roridomyces roridus]|uniref:Uncharacterized protein n=1 Tax=Roridomyces roridus TaxID=1738132 RepID=A0AAD7FWA8_9AGAR|nr:hypothetical protein FB45DRAFT_862366 [Roridomyces roridus]
MNSRRTRPNKPNHFSFSLDLGSTLTKDGPSAMQETQAPKHTDHKLVVAETAKTQDELESSKQDKRYRQQATTETSNVLFSKEGRTIKPALRSRTLTSLYETVNLPRKRVRFALPDDDGSSSRSARPMPPPHRLRDMGLAMGRTRNKSKSTTKCGSLGWAPPPRRTSLLGIWALSTRGKTRFREDCVEDQVRGQSRRRRAEQSTGYADEKWRGRPMRRKMRRQDASRSLFGKEEVQEEEDWSLEGDSKGGFSPVDFEPIAL